MAHKYTADELRDECSIPDEWTVTPTAPTGSIEISLLDSDGGFEGPVLELIQDESTDYAELVISHTNMPGRIEATKLQHDEAVETIRSIPSQCGVLGFHSIQAAVEAISELVDEDGETIANIADTRDFVTHDGTPDVLPAVQKHAEISDRVIKNTFGSI